MGVILDAASRPRSGAAQLVIASAFGYLVLFAWAMQHTDYDVWGALIVGPMLALITWPILRKLAASEGDPGLVSFFMGALALKFAGSLVRYAAIYEVYSGVADASTYNNAGRLLAPEFRRGLFTYAERVGVFDAGDRIVGTNFIKIFTGGLYALIGPTEIGGFFVFAWLCFVGLLLFYRAFRMTVPDGDAHRYRLLLFLAPSLLFWPSSLGKDALMVFGLGVAAYGGARVYTHLRYGFLIAAAGLGFTLCIRPHVTLLAILGLALGYLIRRSRSATAVTPLAKGFGMIVVIIGAVFVASQMRTFFDLDGIDAKSLETVLLATAEQTATGGSEVIGHGGAFSVGGVVAVLFRPFPWETYNMTALAQSIESSFLLLLVLVSLRRVGRALTGSLRNPYLAFVLVYTTAFVLAFSSIANFGILSRERVQVLPMFFVLLCMNAPPLARFPGRREREVVTAS
ncbi:MAG: hypothetical protein QOG87_1571 [Actinomycetota bacterium]|jgi:hypothetical protein